MEQNNLGLYDPSFEHDSCGIGFIANTKGIKNHQLVLDALTVLGNMVHRGASGSESNSGDGAGILVQIPHEFFFSECLNMGIHLPEYEHYGVGVLFLPQDNSLRETCKAVFERVADKLNLEILGYRSVPVNNSHLGETAKSVEPVMEHVFIARPDETEDPMAFERKLYVLRKHTTHLVKNTVKLGPIGFYISSLSYKTISYKGQFISNQVLEYFPDLQDPSFTSALALVHSRFATNTSPAWRLAQPFRYLAHNGEINTIQGNINWLKSSEKAFFSDYFSKEEMDMILPIISGAQSDSASLDNMIELLVLCGRSLPHVMMMLVPEAWDGDDKMDEDRKAFYKFHACLMEPWDGPAALCFTDGNIIGATLDRNGLRPSRYYITNDDRVILSSEVGTLGISEDKIIEKGKLQAGKMFIVDTQEGRIISDAEIKNEIIHQSPYKDWIEEYQFRLKDLPEPIVEFIPLTPEQIFKNQKIFGFTEEDIERIIKPMALDGKEPIGSMGFDSPLAVLSRQPQHLSYYFKQLFAQVTNPPIDPIRESMVMSLATFVGNPGNILQEKAESCHSITLRQPILSSHEIEKIRSIDTGMFQAKTIQCYFKADGEKGSLKAGLDRICRYALDAVEDGFALLILSDRGIDSKHAAIPSLLAVSTVHHHLMRKGKRGKMGLIVEAGDAWEVHHFACLIGFGATAINPYLALSTIVDCKKSGLFQSDYNEEELQKNYIKAVDAGLLKVFSKMGISTLQSYNGAQIFEIIGINKNVVNHSFTGAISRIGGLDFDDIAREVLAKHKFGFTLDEIPVERLPTGGVYQWKRKGETHLFNPDTIHFLQHSTRTKNYKLFKKYSKLINEQEQNAVTLRSFFNLKNRQPSISIDEVEPAENIYKRFATGAMSFGSISWEAHTTLAIAMNRIGGRSNTGEGGEDPSRYVPLENGDSLRSSIKQVASGRFGVTSQYLAEADEIQIKMAQGAKPGEGGQLPGHKVDEWIGKTRYATPGVGLISPPPHHDIYSIEDLSQLISDLKKANRHARINVKLVSKAGVGTIAAGVVKAKADVVLISGYDGGTGASPISSLRHAGLPWELGLAEAQQTLVMNKLRSRTILQADGQMKTGRDIAVATLLGAEEWGLSTAALIVEGCIMMRKCHLNTCPVGVATQNKELRSRFTGEADHVVTFFEFIVQEFREIMAELGFRTVDEMVGRTEYLQVKPDIEYWKHKTLDLSTILQPPASLSQTLYNSESQDHELNDALDWKLIKAAKPALKEKINVTGEFEIKNTDRTVGTILSHELTKIYKSEGLPEDTIHFKFSGHAGQSFGAFVNQGITLDLTGDANDYFGKGLSGGKLIVKPSPVSPIIADENIIIGNTALYGATSGQVFIRGKAGERFAVRNSGVTAVVEGVNDHGCEYMTGGRVLILGETGRNFGAGMSGGIAYVLNENNSFIDKCNIEMIDLDHCENEDHHLIYELIQKHVDLTGSLKGKRIIDDFDLVKHLFIKVFPKEYKRALSLAAKEKVSV